ADGWNFQKGGHLPGGFRRHALEYQREASGLFELKSLRSEDVHRGVVPSLQLHTSQGIDRLRRQAEVSHHRPSRDDYVLHDVCMTPHALELNCMSARPDQLVN